MTHTQSLPRDRLRQVNDDAYVVYRARAEGEWSCREIDGNSRVLEMNREEVWLVTAGALQTIRKDASMYETDSGTTGELL